MALETRRLMHSITMMLNIGRARDQTSTKLAGKCQVFLQTTKMITSQRDTGLETSWPSTSSDKSQLSLREIRMEDSGRMEMDSTTRKLTLSSTMIRHRPRAMVQNLMM